MEIPASIRPALELYAERLRDRFGARLRSVTLFGSFARGEASEESDVDVLVLVDGLTAVEAGIAGGEAAPVILATGLPLSPLPLSTEQMATLRERERLLPQVIDAEGIPL